ncbi:Transmembrane protein 53 [Folsomia candida]|uniref:Transmembrane protein 53 n=1 Tax=Folsomia candida TaxID=158441 RepID=A0A226E1G9_FOLCA|nr:Transmembrane protein 53 [Folsomia candida]
MASNETPNLIDKEDDSCEVPDMDLDFHIQFPTPGYAGSNSTEEENGNTTDKKAIEKIWPVSGYDDKDAAKDTKEDKEIVVILLGWAGSKHKNLSKYSDIYLKRGCIVLRYITPVKALFVQTGKLPVLSNRLIHLISDLQLESHPIFFHVFSNGGSFTYASILRELYKMQDKLCLDIRGTIFDSAPTPRNLGKCFGAVSNIFENFGVVRFLIASIAVLLIVIQVFWMHFKSAIQLCLWGEQLSSLDPVKYHIEEIPLRNWLGRLGKMRNHHYLFLYSDNDDLIPWTLVEEFADIAATQGNYVVKRKFAGLYSLHDENHQ